MANPNVPPTIPLSAATGRAAMPVKGTKDAPKTFTGTSASDELDDFLERFSVLADNAKLNDEDRLKSVLQYVDKKTKRLFEVVDGFDTRVWKDFEASLRLMYPSKIPRITTLTLQTFVAKSANRKIAREEDLMEFYRTFLTYAKYLEKNKKITTEERNSFFWFALPSRLQEDLLPKLEATHQNHDRTTAWEMKDVFALLQKKFDPAVFENDSPVRFLAQTLTDESDSDEEEKKSKRKKKKGKKKAVSSDEEESDNEEEEDEPPKAKQGVLKKTVKFAGDKKDKDEFDNLIGKLSELRLDEPQYIKTYGKLARLDPGVMALFPKPRISGFYVNNAGDTVPVPTSEFTYKPGAAAATNQQHQQYAQQAPPGQGPSRQPPAPRLQRYCYFCLESDSTCPGIKWCRLADQYVREGKVVRQEGQLRLPDGSRIPNMGQGIRATLDSYYANNQSQTKPAAPAATPTNMYFVVSAEPPQTSFFAERVDVGTEAVSSPAVLAEYYEDVYEGLDAEIYGTETPLVAAVQTRAQAKLSTARAPRPNAAPPVQNPSAARAQPPVASGSQPPQQPIPPPLPPPIPPVAANPTVLQPTRPPPPVHQGFNRPVRPGPQYQFRSKMEDERVVGTVYQKMMDATIKMDVREALAISPELRKKMSEDVRMMKVTPPGPGPTVSAAASVLFITTLPTPLYTKSAREIDVGLPNNIGVRGVWDTASSLVCLRLSEAMRCGHPVNWNIGTGMKTADGHLAEIKGVVECLPLQIGSISTLVHAYIVADEAPYTLLLGLPFHHYVKGSLRPPPGDGDDWTVEIKNPLDFKHSLIVKTYAHEDRPGTVPNLFLSEVMLPNSISVLQRTADVPDHEYLEAQGLVLRKGDAVTEQMKSETPTGGQTVRYNMKSRQGLPLGAGDTALVYKKVENKVRPIATTMPDAARVRRRIPRDPLLDLPKLSTHPPEFTPTGRITQERFDAFGIKNSTFLWPEEQKLAGQVFMLVPDVFGWEALEVSTFSREYFSDVVIPLVEHIPWAKRSPPIPPGLLNRFTEIITDHFKAGIFEESNASYRSPVFSVYKKDNDIRLVHDLQELNRHTIKDATLPPPIETFAEWYAGSVVYTVIDLLNGFYGRILAEESRDATTFPTPFGNYRLTRVPIGGTNSLPVFQGDVAFVLQPEAKIAKNYVDDLPVKGLKTMMNEETIPENPGIRLVIWLHLNDVLRILWRLYKAGITVSGKKFRIAVPEADILGYRCDKDGRRPDPRKVDKILKWPRPKDVPALRGLLGTIGDVRIFIKDYSQIARPLFELLKKEAEFVWTDAQEQAMITLKELATNAPCIMPIDYECGHEVVLRVDSSNKAGGWVVTQKNAEGKPVPARYGSISWNETQSRYSQPKIELYGLFRALHATRLHLIGLPTFAVEMDASSIKGMLNNPDLAPNAVINRWIAAIQLFDFTLCHVPAKNFKGPDGLSRRDAAEDDIKEGEDAEEWVDDQLGLGVWGDSWKSALASESGEVSNAATKGSDDQASVFSLTAVSYAYLKLNDPPSTTVIPRTDTSTAQDDILIRVEEFLRTLQKAEGVSNEHHAKIVIKARGFFVHDGELWKRQRDGKHQKVISYSDRLGLLMHAHDRLGHKGKYSTRRNLLDRVWWPNLENDVDWYCESCHECQIRAVDKILVSPTISMPATLFHKVHVDTMFMPKSQGKRYLIQARDSLTSYVEAAALHKENAKTVGEWFYQQVLCRWGAVCEVTTDNGPAMIAAFSYLCAKYLLHHIRVAEYNSRAQGPVERTHRTLRDSLVKASDGNIKQWVNVLPAVLWADRCTVRKAIGMSPFQMAHGIEPVLPFDATLATYLAPKVTDPLTTSELIAMRAVQLMKREEDLALIAERLIKSRCASLDQFKRDFANNIRPQVFEPGTLVLVRNVRAEHDLGGKHLPRYYGPMIVVHRSRNGAYRLGELDGSMSDTRYAPYRILPYHARDPVHIDVTRVFAVEDIEDAQGDDDENDDMAGEGRPTRRSARLRGIAPEDQDEDVDEVED